MQEDAKKEKNAASKWGGEENKGGCGDEARQGLEVLFVAILYGIQLIFPSSVPYLHMYIYCIYM